MCVIVSDIMKCPAVCVYVWVGVCVHVSDCASV